MERLRDREVACSASDLQGFNCGSCVWRAVSSHSPHHPQEVLLAQFSLYVHNSCLKPDSVYFILNLRITPDSVQGNILQANQITVRAVYCATCLKGAPTRRWPNVDLMLAHRLRRWPNIKPVMCQLPATWLEGCSNRCVMDVNVGTVCNNAVLSAVTGTTRRLNVGLVAAHRLRRWPNTKPTLA